MPSSNSFVELRWNVHSSVFRKSRLMDIRALFDNQKFFVIMKFSINEILVKTLTYKTLHWNNHQLTKIDVNSLKIAWISSKIYKITLHLENADFFSSLHKKIPLISQWNPNYMWYSHQRENDWNRNYFTNITFSIWIFQSPFISIALLLVKMKIFLFHSLPFFFGFKLPQKDC